MKTTTSSSSIFYSKYLFSLVIILVFNSCAYKSTIIKTNYKKNHFVVNYLEKPEIENSILNETFDIIDFKTIDSSRDSGEFQIYLTNKNTFIKVVSIKSNKDSLILRGVISDLEKTRSDSIKLKVKFYNSDFKVINTGKNSFRTIFGLKENSEKNIDSKELFYQFSKSQNFQIVPDVLELLTGEVSSSNGNNYKYLIVNDPEKIEYILKSVCILTILNKEELRKECLKKYEEKCSKGYIIEFDYDIFSFWKKKVKCLCKQNN